MAREWQKYVRVDTIVECWSITKPVERALLEAMPDAYGGTPPGEDDWPEPDRVADRPYVLDRCWDKLPGNVQQALEACRQAWDDFMEGKIKDWDAVCKEACTRLVGA